MDLDNNDGSTRTKSKAFAEEDKMVLTL